MIGPVLALSTFLENCEILRLFQTQKITLTSYKHVAVLLMTLILLVLSQIMLIQFINRLRARGKDLTNFSLFSIKTGILLDKLTSPQQSESTRIVSTVQISNPKLKKHPRRRKMEEQKEIEMQSSSRIQFRLNESISSRSPSPSSKSRSRKSKHVQKRTRKSKYSKFEKNRQIEIESTKEVISNPPMSTSRKRLVSSS